MEHDVTRTAGRLLAGISLAALAATSPATALGSEMLVGSYTYGWMGSDLGTACGLPGPAVLTRVRLGTATFEADGRVLLWFDERTYCPGGGSEEASTSIDATYALDQDGQLVVDLDPAQPGTVTWTFLMSWDRDIGTLALDEERDGGYPAIGVLLRKGTGLASTALLGDHTIVRVRETQVAGGIEMRGSFGTISFLPGDQYTQDVVHRTIDPYGSSAVSEVKSGPYALAPDGTLTLNDGTQVGAVTPDGSFGLLVLEATFGSMFSVFARIPTAEPTLFALDDQWWMATYGATREEAPFAEVVPRAESGVLAFEARSGRALVGQSEVWADMLGGGARGGFTFLALTPRVMGSYELGAPGDPPLPLRLGRTEDVVLFAKIDSPEEVWVGVAPRTWGPLAGDAREVAISAGGKQTLSVRAGATYAGRPYLILGSLSGTYPGTTFGGSMLSLNPDRYFRLTLTNPDPPLSGSSGILDELGAARAAFEPPGSWVNLVGTTVHHVCVVFQGDEQQAVVLSSNAVPVLLAN